MAVTPEAIAVELGRATPDAGSPTWQQWQGWIDRAIRAIRTRATRLGVDFASLDPDAVNDVVTYAVARRITRPPDGAESTTDQINVDDGTVMQTRRWQAGMGDIFILDQWWDHLGLAEPDIDGWSGSIAYSRR